MSLKDELLKEQKDAEKKAADAAKLAENQKKEAEEQKKRDLASKYYQIKRDIANGNPPKDYIELYEKYVARIRECVKKGEKSFHFSDEVSREYYEQKASVTNALGSEIDLLTSYMIKRLKNDGFYNINFELKEEHIAYATEMDKRATQNNIEKAEREAKEKYDDDLRRYYSEKYSADRYGSSNYSVEPNMYSKKYEPKHISPVMTGRRRVYTMTLDCSLQGITKTKKIERRMDQSAAFMLSSVVAILVWIAAGCGLGYLFISVLEWQLIWGVIGAFIAGALAAGAVSNLLLIITGNGDLAKKLSGQK